MRRWGLCWLWLGFVLCGFAQPIEKIPNPRATDGGWVVDIAGVLNASQKKQLNALISDLESETGAEVAVVIIRKAQEATPKEYATELFNKWGVGKRGVDNGVLMLVALQDRRVEIETGYGMEWVLPDGLVGAILDEAVIPHFRQGRYAQGILAGVERIAEAIRNAEQTGAYEIPARPYDAPAPIPVREPVSFPLGLPMAVLAVLLLGAGGIVWAVAILFERPLKCPLCGRRMSLLNEQEDDAFLNTLQRTEERLRSVNYLVWRCEECDAVEIVPKVSWFTPYSKCPKCRGYTVLTHTHVVRRPTYTRKGLAIERRQCKNPQCRYTREKERKLPVLQRDDWFYRDREGARHRAGNSDWFGTSGWDWSIGSGSSTGSSGDGDSFGGWSGSGDSFGGGWSGGGSSGSSWSGGGSFGGGSSGGGGAGRSW